MGAAFFYHMTQAPLEVTLPTLLGKARGAGWRVEVRGTTPDRMAWLDEKLWLGDEEGFLPHGLAGGAHDARQPILLCIGAKGGNDAGCVMAVDGAEVDPEEVERLDRVCILFDGHDPQAVDHARGQWKRLKDAGCKAQYWAQDASGWAKKAET